MPVYLANPLTKLISIVLLIVAVGVVAPLGIFVFILEGCFRWLITGGRLGWKSFGTFRR